MGCVGASLLPETGGGTVPGETEEQSTKPKKQEVAMVSFDKTITDRSSPPEPGTKLVPASAVQRFICRKNFTFSKEKAAPPPPIAGYMDPQDSDDESRSYPSDAFEASVNDRAGTKDRSGSKASGSSAHVQAATPVRPSPCPRVDEEVPAGWFKAGPAALTGGEDGTLRIWDLDSCSQTRQLRGTGTSLTCIAVDWENFYALTGEAGGTLVLWDLRLGEPLEELSSHTGDVFCAGLSWSSRRAISGGADEALRLWTLDHNVPMALLSGHRGSVLCLAVDWEADRAISGGADMTLRLWDVRVGKNRAEMRHTELVKCVSMDWSRRRAVSGTAAGYLCIWHLETFELVSKIRPHPYGVRCISVDWEAGVVLSGSWKGALFLTEMDTGEVLTRLEAHNHTVLGIQADWKMMRALSTSQAGTHGGGLARVWDLRTGCCIAVLGYHDCSVKGLAASWVFRTLPLPSMTEMTKGFRSKLLDSPVLLDNFCRHYFCKHDVNNDNVLDMEEFLLLDKELRQRFGLSALSEKELREKFSMRFRSSIKPLDFSCWFKQQLQVLRRD